MARINQVWNRIGERRGWAMVVIVAVLLAALGAWASTLFGGHKTSKADAAELAVQPLTLTILSQTSTKITVGWTPPAGIEGYVYRTGSSCSSTTRVSNTWNVAAKQVTFAKLAGTACYEVEAVSKTFDGTLLYPPVPPTTTTTPTTTTVPTTTTPGLPAMTFLSPTAGTISGQVIWNVTSPVAFDHIDFWIDNQPVSWTERTYPCYYNGDPDGRLNTALLSNGSHTLNVAAYNSSGVKVAAGSRTVTVSNGTPTTTTVPTTTTPTTTTVPATTTIPSTTQHTGTVYVAPS